MHKLLCLKLLLAVVPLFGFTFAAESLGQESDEAETTLKTSEGTVTIPASAFNRDPQELLKVAIGFFTVGGTIMVIVLFAMNYNWRWKWEDASGFQKMVAIGIGVPLWIAIFGSLIGGAGSWVAVGGILFSFAVIVFSVNRWKRRKHVEEASQTNQQSYEEEARAVEPDQTLKKCYDVLDVSEGATSDEIKKTYKKLAKQWHPDSHKSARKKIAELEMKKINEAYEMLEKAGMVK